MDLEMLIADYGYLAFFFAFCLGIIGLPVPNEMVVMTGGAASANDLLIAFPAFLMIYLGICCGLTVGYVVGHFVGLPVLQRIARKPKFAMYVDRSQRLVSKYGNGALLFTYFIPVVRNVMPYVVGANGMKYKTFAMFAYTGAFVWSVIFFAAGALAADNIDALSWDLGSSAETD